MENTSESTKKRGRCHRAYPTLAFTQQDFDDLYNRINAACTKKTKLPDKPEIGSTEEQYYSFFTNIKAKRNPKLTALLEQFLQDFQVAEGQEPKKKINLNEEGKEAILIREQSMDTQDVGDLENNHKKETQSSKPTNRKTRGQTEQVHQAKNERMHGQYLNYLSRSNKNSTQKADETKEKNMIQVVIKSEQTDDKNNLDKDESFDLILDNTSSQISHSLNSEIIGDNYQNYFLFPQKDNQQIVNNGQAVSQREKLITQKALLQNRSQSQSSFPIPPLSQPYQLSHARAYHEQVIHQQQQQMPYELVARKIKEAKKDPEEEMRKQLSKLRQYYTGSGEYDSLLHQLFKQQDLYKNMLEKIVSKVDEAVHCSICLLLPLVPLACSNCKMIICARCTFDCQIRDTCPICCIQPWGVQKLENSELESLVLKQHYECEYKQFGCKNTNSIEAVLAHENTCHYKAKLCEFCSELIMTTKMQEHVQICDQRLINCSKCSFQFKACQASHHDCISDTVAHYTGLKKEFHQYKLDVEDMLVEQERLINGLMEKLNKQSQKTYPSFASKDSYRNRKLRYINNKLGNDVQKIRESAQNNEKSKAQLLGNCIPPQSQQGKDNEKVNDTHTRDRFQPNGILFQKPITYPYSQQIRQNRILVPQNQPFPFRQFDQQNNSNANNNLQLAVPQQFAVSSPQITSSNYPVFNNMATQRGAQNAAYTIISNNNDNNNGAAQLDLFNQNDLFQINLSGSQQQPSQQDNPFSLQNNFFY